MRESSTEVPENQNSKIDHKAVHAKSSPIKKTIPIPSNISKVKQQVRSKSEETSTAQKQKAKSPQEEENKEKPRNPFSIEELKGVLKEITADYKHQEKNMETAMLKQPVRLQEETVTFILNGELQEHIFTRLKPELTGLLRKKLNNYGLEVQFEIKEQVVEESDKLYTSTDKLAYLCKKSPALKELQKRFGLETDF